jgi:YidC/Oxa1 family membrane protein insertase
MAFGPGVDRHLPEKDRSADEVVTFLAASGFDDVKVKKVGEGKELGPVSWVALGNRYFVAALLPEEGSLSAFARRTTAAGEEVGLRSQVAALGPRQALTYKVALYLGPKDRTLLAAAGKGLELSVDYGWFSWLAIPFLAILQFCFRFLRSYGLAILALTFLVKAALFPISLKMFRSMKKMQELQPKMTALKAKFKNDNQGLQQATMALYREHKVNPMAGCLPMVVQIPVFFALYKVLYNAIELRGAGFLYIPDLSLKDPYYITPILMGVTMLIQQRMTPTVGDPMQAKMMMFMPVIMTAMFINFSSGLVLYFLFSNVMSIGEQKLFRVLGARAQAAAAPEEAPGGGGKKKRLPRP